MTETNEPEYFEPGSDEAMKVLRDNAVIYGFDGYPFASIHYVFPDYPVVDEETFEDEEEREEAYKFVEELAKLFDEDADRDKLHEALKPWKDFLEESDDEEVAAILNSAIGEASDVWFGYKEAQELLIALSRIDDRFGEGEEMFIHYTYNDPDTYCGNDDIQFSFLNRDIYPPDFEAIFLQIHPGGDARNMAEGRFYIPEGIDDTSNLFYCLGTYVTELGSTLEIPTAFPFEQYLREHETDHWENDIYREEKEVGDRWVKSDLLYRHDFNDEGMCRVYLPPESDNESCRVYGCHEIGDMNDWWDWVPTGKIVGQMKSTAGISATPWKPAEVKYSTGGYFKWVGPMPGTKEWEEMLEEYDLPAIEPHKPENKNQKQLSL